MIHGKAAAVSKTFDRIYIMDRMKLVGAQISIFSLRGLCGLGVFAVSNAFKSFTTETPRAPRWRREFQNQGTA